MKEPSDEFKRILDIITAVFVILLFTDYFLWFAHMCAHLFENANKTGDTSFFVLIGFCGSVFLFLFFISIIYFFVKLAVKKRAYELSQKVILVAAVSWISLPLGPFQSYFMVSPFWLFLPLFLFVIGKRFLRWGFSYGKIDSWSSMRKFLVRPEVSRDCKDYYAYKAGWIGFLLALSLVSLFFIATLYGGYSNMPYVQGYKLVNVFFLCLSVAFVIQITVLVRLTVLSYAEDGIYGAFMLAGAYASAPIFLLDNWKYHPFVAYSFILLIFILAVVAGVEFIDEWMEYRRRERSADKREWLTFK